MARFIFEDSFGGWPSAYAPIGRLAFRLPVFPHQTTKTSNDNFPSKGLPPVLYALHLPAFPIQTLKSGKIPASNAVQVEIFYGS